MNYYYYFVFKLVSFLKLSCSRFCVYHSCISSSAKSIAFFNVNVIIFIYEKEKEKYCTCWICLSCGISILPFASSSSSSTVSVCFHSVQHSNVIDWKWSVSFHFALAFFLSIWSFVRGCFRWNVECVLLMYEWNWIFTVGLLSNDWIIGRQLDRSIFHFQFWLSSHQSRDHSARNHRSLANDSFLHAVALFFHLPLNFHWKLPKEKKMLCVCLSLFVFFWIVLRVKCVKNCVDFQFQFICFANNYVWFVFSHLIRTI